MSNCQHKEFHADVNVTRLTDGEGSEKIIGYAADARIICDECKIRFVFLGLPEGVIRGGAARSIDGTEARLYIAPEGTTETFLTKAAKVIGGKVH